MLNEVTDDDAGPSVASPAKGPSMKSFKGDAVEDEYEEYEEYETEDYQNLGEESAQFEDEEEYSYEEETVATEGLTEGGTAGAEGEDDEDDDEEDEDYDDTESKVSAAKKSVKSVQSKASKEKLEGEAPKEGEEGQEGAPPETEEPKKKPKKSFLESMREKMERHLSRKNSEEDNEEETGEGDGEPKPEGEAGAEGVEGEVKKEGEPGAEGEGAEGEVKKKKKEEEPKAKKFTTFDPVKPKPDVVLGLPRDAAGDALLNAVVNGAQTTTKVSSRIHQLLTTLSKPRKKPLIDFYRDQGRKNAIPDIPQAGFQIELAFDWLRAPSSEHQFGNSSKPTGTYVKIHDGGLLHSVNDDLLEIMIETSELNPKFCYPISAQLTRFHAT